MLFCIRNSFFVARHLPYAKKIKFALISFLKTVSYILISVLIHEPAVLIEGVLFRARYLGSTQLVCEGQPTKATRMMQAEEAVSRIKVII